MHVTREQWLLLAVENLRDHFAIVNYTIPQNLRVSCGLPSSKAFTAKRAIGEAWCSTNSKDQSFEIFISPTIDKPEQVLAVLVHELVHVTVGLKAGHKGAFQKCAGAVGLTGPWTMTTASDELANYLAVLRAILGEYPHKSLNKMTNEKKKQNTRLIKAYCESCTYTIRLTMRWILEGRPVCPNEECNRYGKPFEIDLPDADLEAIEV